MTSNLLAAGSMAPIDEVLTWLIQSTVLLSVGLLAGRFLKGRGPAVQSALYRTILVAVLVCPIASMASAAMGFPGLVIRVPSAAAEDKVKVADHGPDRVGPIARQELAHPSRRDGLWNLLRQLVTAALWVQPLLWVLSRRIEETAEEVCDDFVVAFGADRGRYAGHLLELAGAGSRRWHRRQSG